MILPIKGLQKTSLVDYVPYVVSTIFLGFCPLRCTYCYNINLVKYAKKLPTISEESILNFLESRIEWIDGVCITGGEPCMHKELPSFIAKIKKLNSNFKIKLDTNGVNPGMLTELTTNKMIDYIAMDIKCPLEKYEQITQVKTDIVAIQESINIIKSCGVDYEFRTTAAPDLVSKDDFLEIGKLLKGSKRYYLQQFKTGTDTIDPAFKTKKSYSIDELQQLSDLIKDNFDSCKVRTL
jgi:pyruvate formate lyase activating enzyme